MHYLINALGWPRGLSKGNDLDELLLGENRKKLDKGDMLHNHAPFGGLEAY